MMIGIDRQKDARGRWTGKFYKYYFDMQTNTTNVLQDDLDFSTSYLFWSTTESVLDTIEEDMMYYFTQRKIRVPWSLERCETIRPSF